MRLIKLSTYIAALLILITVLAVSTSVAQTATTLEIVSGNNQKALFGTTLPNPLVVRVLDQNSNAMSGVTVSFAITHGDPEGGASVTPTSATTGSNGQASTSLTLGNANLPGFNRIDEYDVTASVTGLTDVVFTAQGLRPTNFSRVSPTSPTGPAGEWLPNPFVIILTDRAGARLPGATIVWEFRSGNPSTDARLSQTRTKTNAQGESSIRVKLGSVPGRYYFKAKSRDSKNYRDILFWPRATAARPPEVRVDSFRRDSGDDQRIITTQSSTDPLIVTVLDEYNEPLRNAQVNFSVEPSDAVLNPPTVRTDANGQASTVLTFGAANVYTLTATVLRDPSLPELSPITFIVERQVEKQKRRIIQECPVGWVRSDGFAGRNRRALIYEVKLQMDIGNPISIYKPDWVAIYVHPDEGLENLEGWKLQVALPYNHHREYPLTAENAVVVDAGFVEGGFAFIENPEENPFPMVGVGFTGSPAPGFDYRLYDETAKRVDFGISCYKRGDIFQVLKEMEDPRVLRQVLLESFDWDAYYLRSEWTVPTPAPAAPSLVKKNVVGTWADLKKQ